MGSLALARVRERARFSRLRMRNADSTTCFPNTESKIEWRLLLLRLQGWDPGLPVPHLPLRRRSRTAWRPSALKSGSGVRAGGRRGEGTKWGHESVVPVPAGTARGL